jgi:hypothetical protein
MTDAEKAMMAAQIAFTQSPTRKNKKRLARLLRGKTPKNAAQEKR